MDCVDGNCDTTEYQNVNGEAVASPSQAEDPLNPTTFVPPPFAGAPSITIEFCDRCRWLHRATWTQTELFLTFPPPAITSISLIPLTTQETAGRFRVWLSYHMKLDAVPTMGDSCDTTTSGQLNPPVMIRELVWDRKVEGGFPELKVLKQRIRDKIQPGVSLGHSDTVKKPGE